MTLQTENLRITSMQELTSPSDLSQQMPVPEATAKVVLDSRAAIQNVLHGRDDRLVAIVGPCSIHDPRRRWITRPGWPICARVSAGRWSW